MKSIDLEELKFIRQETSECFGPLGCDGNNTRDYYVCPCGKSEVVYWKDREIGYKDWGIVIKCEECKKEWK